METLLPAFLLVLIAQAPDRSAILSATLGARFGARPVLVAAIAMALALGFALAAAAGVLVAPMLSPRAGTLLVALALIAAGLGAIRRSRLTDTLQRWRIGPFATGFAGLFILALGDASQFLVFAIAARDASPLLAMAGATVAAVTIHIAAIALGPVQWARLTPAALRWGSAALFLVIGSASALSALRLV